MTIGQLIWIKEAGTQSTSLGSTDQRSEILRRRIALYRRYLAEGVDAELARHYLHEIRDATAELAEIERDSGKREPPAS